MENNINEKIEKLNLIALRKYACPKINSQNDWYLKCVECKSLDGCPAGRRAVDIIEGQTKPNELKKRGNRVAAEKRRAEMINILERSKTPEEFYLNWKEMKGNAPSGSNVFTWKKRYPELDKKYNFTKLGSYIQKVTRGQIPIPEVRVDTDGDKNGDEVTIGDFLEELNQKEVDEAVEEVSEAAVEQAADEDLPRDSTDNRPILRLEFGKKRQEFKKRLSYISIQIESLEAAKRGIEEQMRLLDKTAEMFGMKATN